MRKYFHPSKVVVGAYWLYDFRTFEEGVDTPYLVEVMPSDEGLYVKYMPFTVEDHEAECLPIGEFEEHTNVFVPIRVPDLTELGL